MKNPRNYKLLIGLLTFLLGLQLRAEGTKEIRPQANTNGGIQIIPRVDPAKPFALIGGSADYRLNVHICNAGETIHMGFGDLRLGTANPMVRLVDPDDVVVVANTAIGVAGQDGYIATYNQAVSGPISATNPGGYTPISFTATKTGDYSIQFNNSVSEIHLLDITVVGTDGNIKKGRLWSKAWLMNTGFATNPFYGSMYVYTDDMITTKINFNGIKPFEFMISSNSTGTNKTGNLINDRKSVYGNSTYPQYRIFLNEPDSVCYPTGFLGSIVGTPTITGCPGDYCINVEVTAPGTMQFLLNADGIPNFQEGGKDRMIQANVVAGKINCIKWDGKDGLGNKIDTNVVEFKMGISYVNGLSHLPIYDVEDHPSGYIVTYVRPRGLTGNIPLQWDDNNLRDPSRNLQGCLDNGCHQWLNRGKNNNGICPNCPETVNTWWYVKESQANVVSHIKDKDIDANRRDPRKGKWNDTLVCAADTALQLNAVVKGDKGVQWKLLKGSGSFADDTLASTIYTFGANDYKNTNVTFLIASKGDACPAVYDTMKVLFDPVKTMLIAPLAPICSNTPQALNINASLNSATKISWAGGQGTFTPNRTSASFRYTPTAQELIDGKVKFFANTTDNVVSCPNVKDSVELKLILAPIVEAPKDTLFCINASNIPLNLEAKYQNADSLKWFVNNPANFTFDKDTGSVVSGTITNNSSQLNIRVEAYRKGCTTAIDHLLVNSSPLKSITVSDPAPICDKNPKINVVTATPVNTNKIQWITAGGTVAPNDSATSISYTPTATEISTGRAMLIAKTNEAIPLCPNKSDTTWVNLAIPPTVEGPKDTLLCESILVKTLPLSSTSTFADSILWSVDAATAQFANTKTANTTLNLVNNTKALVKVTAFKTGCPSAVDSSLITFATPPVITAKAQPTCDTDLKFILTGNLANAQTNDIIAWSRTTSKGSFSADSTIISNNYIPSASDITNGTLQLGLRHIAVDKCPAKDTLIHLFIAPLPISDAGKNTWLCRNTEVVQKTSVNPVWSYAWRNSPDTMQPVLSNKDSVKLMLSQDTDLFLTVKNSMGCIATDSARLRVLDPPQIQLDPHRCLYNPIQLTATVTQMPPLGKYVWIKEGVVSTDTLPNITITKPGTYKYAYSYQHCKQADSIYITLPPIAKVDTLVDCTGTAGFLKADSTYKATYIWNGAVSSSPRYPVIVTAGQQNITLTVRDSLGCESNTNSITKGVPKPEFDMIAKNICIGETGKIVALLQDPSLASAYNITHRWTTSNGSIVNGTLNAIAFNVPDTYTLALSIGKCQAIHSKAVLVHPKPQIDIPKEHKYCFEESEPIKLDASKTYTSYAWYTKGTLIDTTKAIEVKPLIPTSYRLSVSNQYGCKDSIPVHVEVSCPPRLFVPNVLTPDSKDVNSVMNVYGAFYTDFELTVFNRWGEIIYETNDPRATWDGTYRGELMPIGVYPWIISYDAEYEEYKKPNKFKLKGDITLIR